MYGRLGQCNDGKLKAVQEIGEDEENMEDDIVEENAGDNKGKRKAGSKSASGAKKAKASVGPKKTPTQVMLPLIEGELRPFQLKGKLPISPEFI